MHCFQVMSKSMRIELMVGFFSRCIVTSAHGAHLCSPCHSLHNKAAGVWQCGNAIVDGDTSTNDCVIGLASGAAGTPLISDANSAEGKQLEAALTALLQHCLQFCGRTTVSLHVAYTRTNACHKQEQGRVISTTLSKQFSFNPKADSNNWTLEISLGKDWQWPKNPCVINPYTTQWAGSYHGQRWHAFPYRTIKVYVRVTMACECSQGLAKSIAWDGEGATCLLEVECVGARTDAEARQ
eukprot:scaffold70360_cov24-Tisochrysis_lutea.AAC.1